MRFAPESSKDYHLVSVEFKDGSLLQKAKVYNRCELGLPPEYIGKKIKTFAANLHQP
jgi:hypothetical protein